MHLQCSVDFLIVTRYLKILLRTSEFLWAEMEVMNFDMYLSIRQDGSPCHTAHQTVFCALNSVIMLSAAMAM